jgi:hypothetical protein
MVQSSYTREPTQKEKKSDFLFANTGDLDRFAKATMARTSPFLRVPQRQNLPTDPTGVGYSP